MRRLPFLACALAAARRTRLRARGSGPGTGGTAAPSSRRRDVRAAGSARFAAPPAPPPARWRREFSVAPATLDAGTPATFAFRVDGRARTVRVRIELTARGRAAPAVRLRLGYQRTGVRHTLRRGRRPRASCPPASTRSSCRRSTTPAARCAAPRKASGRSRVSVQVAPPPVAPAPPGVFPVAGRVLVRRRRTPASAPGATATSTRARTSSPPRARRSSPRSRRSSTGSRSRRRRRPLRRGARRRRHRLRLHAHQDGLDHGRSRAPSLAAGQPFAQVGSTGAASGPHLHFEIWPDGWYSSKASQPIDPLPQLQAWAATR